METIGASHSTAACKAFFQRHHVLEARGIFADAAAAGAGEVAGVQRFELQDHRKLGRLAELVLDDVTGDFFRQRKGESHNYWVRATSVEISGNEAGALVAGGSAFKKCPAPGSKKSKGETLWLVLMPAQPAPKSASATGTASQGNLQYNLTCPV